MSPHFNSITWRLQVWYGLLLVVLLSGLGLAAYRLEHDKVYRRVDDALKQRVRTLAETLNGPGAPPPRLGFPGDQAPPRPPPPSAATFHLAPRDAALFGPEGEGFYFRILAATGEEIAHSTNAPAMPALRGGVSSERRGSVNATDGRRRSDQTPLQGRSGSRREIDLTTPTHEHIMVGCFVGADLAELHRTAWELVGIGGFTLILGLSIGGWLVAHALRPIADISAAAEKISTGDLTQRINVSETRSELGRLAAVLNSMFARLEAAFTQQRRFAADAAHELRTPVSTLLAQTGAALNRQRTNQEYLQTIEACHRAAQRMRRLIGSLLQLARLESGQPTQSPTEFDLADLTEECVQNVQPLAAERGVRLQLEAASVPLHADPEQISQVITNLLTNAIQYNRSSGEVRVKTGAENGAVVLTVADTGVGIAPADLPHIFERFYRADKSRASGNAGLGLAIAQTIVTAHGGKIEVSSREHEGTTFTVRFPKP